MTIKRIFFFLILLSLYGVSIAACQQVGDPNVASDRIKRGNACYDNKDYSKAVSLYTEAIKADPKGIQAAFAHYRRANIFNATGRFDEAISECSSSIGIDPLMNKGIAYLLRGFLYEKTGKYAQASTDYAKVLVLNPDDEVAAVCRKRLLLRTYADFTNKGLAALDSGIKACDNKDFYSAGKDLDKALALFTDARQFDTGDQTAEGMTYFTKGLQHQALAGKITDTLKPSNSRYKAVSKLRKAYYTLAVANAYYDRVLPFLEYDKLINSVNERKAANSRDITEISGKLTGLDRGAEIYMKAIDLEARCIVNFDIAGTLIGKGDHEGAKPLLTENDSLAPDLKKLKDPNAEGIICLTAAYGRLNTTLSHPLNDKAWLEANKASLQNELNACIDDLDRAKAGLVNAALLNTCAALSDNMSTLRKAVNDIGG